MKNEQNILNRIYHKYLDRQTMANSVDPDQMLQNVWSGSALFATVSVVFLDTSMDTQSSQQ